MMKETKIVRENIKFYLENDEADVCKINLKSHKQTCQRWLEEDKEELKYLIKLSKYIKGNHFLRFIDKKSKRVKDLKQVIKLYNEVGI